jgi:actin-related protein
VQQQNLCTRHTTGTKCEEKEKERMVFDPFGQKSTSEKRKTQEKEKKKEEKNQKKKEKKQKGWSKLRPPRWKKDAFRLSNFTSS